MRNEKTNKKALEIANYFAGETDYKESAAYSSAMAMAEWKDEETRNTVIGVWLSSIMLQDHTLSNKDHQYIDLDELKDILEDFFHIKLDEE